MRGKSGRKVHNFKNMRELREKERIPSPPLSKREGFLQSFVKSEFSFFLTLEFYGRAEKVTQPFFVSNLKVVL